MDPRDSRLSLALDELARIGEVSADVSAFEQRESRRNAAILTREEAPVALPAPDPVPIEAPAAVTPAPAAGGLKVKPLPARAAVKSIAPGEGSSHAVLNRARQSSAFSDDLLELAAAEAQASAPPPMGSEAPRPRRRSFDVRGRVPKWAMLPAIACTLAAAGVAGFFVGRANAPAAPRQDGSTSTEASATNEGATESAVFATVSGLTGRISYASDRQTWQPDDGARIIAVPGNAPMGKLLSAEILLDDEKQRDAAAEAAAVHGGFAVAAADGTFELALPTAGVYRVLVVSSRQQRDSRTPLASGVDAFVREWLDRPGLITDERACHFREVRYPGEGLVPFDCVFESAAR
jgi:hypothetical protein